MEGDFRPEAFRHVAFYNEAEARIEMHLVPDSTQDVHLRRLGLRIRVSPDETIWTESCYKFSRASAQAMLEDAGLRLERWYVDRFLRLRETVFRDPTSYFRRYGDLDRTAAVTTARAIWKEINGVNLHQNIAPTRSRARLILEKGPDHAVRRVFLRRV